MIYRTLGLSLFLIGGLLTFNIIPIGLSTVGTNGDVHYFVNYEYISHSNDFTSITATMPTSSTFNCYYPAYKDPVFGDSWRDIHCDFAAYWIYIFLNPNGQGAPPFKEQEKVVGTEVQAGNRQFLQTGFAVNDGYQIYPIKVSFTCGNDPPKLSYQDPCKKYYAPTTAFETYCGILGGTCSSAYSETPSVNSPSVAKWSGSGVSYPISYPSTHKYGLFYNNNGWDVTIDNELIAHYNWPYKAYAVGIALETTCTGQYCRPSTVAASYSSIVAAFTQDAWNYPNTPGVTAQPFTAGDSVRNTFYSFQDSGNINGAQLDCANNQVLFGSMIPSPTFITGSAIPTKNCFNTSPYAGLGAAYPSYVSSTITVSSTTSIITQTQYSTPSAVTSTTTFTYTNPSILSSSSTSISTVTSSFTSNPCQLCKQTPIAQINYIGIPFMIAGAFFLIRRQHE